MTPITFREAKTPRLTLVQSPVAVFRVDRCAGCVVWEQTGLRLREPEDFRVVSDLFLRNGHARSFNALNEAELAVSDVVARRMFADSVATITGPEDAA